MNTKINMGDLVAKLKSVRYGGRLQPLRDWILILSVAAVLLLGSMAWNAWLFIEVANGEILGAASAPTPSVFDHTSVEDVQTLFAKRSDEYQKYLTGAYRFVDPSQ